MPRGFSGRVCVYVRTCTCTCVCVYTHACVCQQLISREAVYLRRHQRSGVSSVGLQHMRSSGTGLWTMWCAEYMSALFMMCMFELMSSSITHFNTITGSFLDSVHTLQRVILLWADGSFNVVEENKMSTSLCFQIVFFPKIYPPLGSIIFSKYTLKVDQSQIYYC